MGVEVRVRYAWVEAWQGSGVLAQGRAWLDEREQARLHSFRVPGLRDEFVAARVLVRAMLSEMASIEPWAWRFVAGAFGKPRIAEPTGHEGLEFNLSHTRGLVACAVTRGVPVGIDVEDELARPVDLSLADQYFARSEAAAIRSLSPRAQSAAFYRLWTLKEAYLKARGTGLSTPLDSFAIDISGPGIELTETAESAFPDRDWRLHARMIGPVHHLALAVAVAPGAVVSWQLERVEWPFLRLSMSAG